MIFVILEPDCRKKGEPVDRIECKRVCGGFLYSVEEGNCALCGFVTKPKPFVFCIPGFFCIVSVSVKT